MRALYVGGWGCVSHMHARRMGRKGGFTVSDLEAQVVVSNTTSKGKEYQTPFGARAQPEQLVTYAPLRASE